jgi:hypothetical protein
MKQTVTALLFATLCAISPAFAAGGPDPAHIILANAIVRPVPVDTFSQQEAQLWILNAGYSQVSGLQHDGAYLYRGTAIMKGETYVVVVDAQGNILGAKE